MTWGGGGNITKKGEGQSGVDKVEPECRTGASSGEHDKAGRPGLSGGKGILVGGGG